MLGCFRAPWTGIHMLKVPRLQPKRSDAIGVKLTVSRVSDGAIEVAISTPGRLKVGRPGEGGGMANRRAKPGASAPRAQKVDRK